MEYGKNNRNLESWKKELIHSVVRENGHTEELKNFLTLLKII